MSAVFTTPNSANRIIRDHGSNVGAYPFAMMVWSRRTAAVSAADEVAFSTFKNGGGTNNAKWLYQGASSQRMYGLHSAGTASAILSSASANEPSDDSAWWGRIMVSRSATDHKFWTGTSSASHWTATSTTNIGTDPTFDWIGVGLDYRGAGDLRRPYGNGKLARAAFWTGFTAGDWTDALAESLLDGANPTATLGASLWGYWPLNDDGGTPNVNDASGNIRHMTIVGTVNGSTDEPFPLTTGAGRMLLLGAG